MEFDTSRREASTMILQPTGGVFLIPIARPHVSKSLKLPSLSFLEVQERPESVLYEEQAGSRESRL